jgi:hypothetical protein
MQEQKRKKSCFFSFIRIGSTSQPCFPMQPKTLPAMQKEKRPEEREERVAIIGLLARGGGGVGATCATGTDDVQKLLR